MSNRVRGGMRAMLWIVLSYCGSAQAEGVIELRVKAAILFNLAQFAMWPVNAFASEQEPIRFCMIAAQPLADALKTGLDGRTIGGRHVLVTQPDTLLPPPRCHVTYIGRRRVELLRLPLPESLGAGLLTVHEADQPLPGGVVRLFNAGDRLRFEISAATARRHQLHLSAKLMSMARAIER